MSVGDVPKRDENIYSKAAAKPFFPRCVCLTPVRLISEYLRTDSNTAVTGCTMYVLYDSEDKPRLFLSAQYLEVFQSSAVF